MQHEELSNAIQEGKVAAVMDLGQNIYHRKQHEAQSSHYNRRQSIIFPTICFFWCTLCSELVMHEICCLLDDLKHDAFAVRAFHLDAVKILEGNGMKVNKMFKWSDTVPLNSKASCHSMCCLRCLYPSAGITGREPWQGVHQFCNLEGFSVHLLCH